MNDDFDPDVMERIIEPARIEVENRGGYDVLVVEDSAGNQFTTLRDDLVEEIPSRREKYVDETWRITWSITPEGYINFHGFDQPVDQEPNKEEIKPEEFEVVRRERLGLSDTDIRITRQSAGHDASRIVAGKLASGQRMTEEEIKQELRKWTDHFKKYYRTGEWELKLDNTQHD